MKVLTIYAHHNPRSFCHAILERFSEGLRDAGHTNEVVDLYAIRFDPVFSDRDSPDWVDDSVPDDVLAHWHVKQSLMAGARNPLRRILVKRWIGNSGERELVRRLHALGPPRDVAEQQAKVANADALAFVAPVYFVGFPAILKGWIERVFSLGFAFGMPARPAVVVGRLLLAASVSLGLGCARPGKGFDDQPLRATDGNFPAAEWRTSPPEAQGFDSEALVALMDEVQAKQLPIHSLHIVRHGHLVLDAYFHPFQREERHDVASVTKSVTTTLVGLALDRGALAGLDVPVYPLLSQTPPSDVRKQQIRLRHLLTTSSGLDCGPEPYEREMLAMAASADWVRFALDLPMREMPGTRFVYCSPGFHLLSALITRSTGLAAEDFARQVLFAPIGIGDVVWPRDPQGISQGAGDLQMRPRDLLRLGYLFLRRGEWNGQQIIPNEWVAQATRRHLNTTGPQGYGFGWWISADIPGLYEAHGRGGQRLIVWPAKDIVVVVTAGGLDPALIAPFLLRSLKSDAALPENPQGHERLLARARAAAHSRATAGTAPPLPPRAAVVSGVDHVLEPNPLDVRGMQLHFLNPALAQARLRLRDTELVVPVGLDGAYRVGIDPASGRRVAGRGHWSQPDRFVLEIDTIARISHFTVVLDFEHRGLRGIVDERSGLINGLALRGRAAN